MLTHMIAVEHLIKRYPKRPDNAVDGISFQVAKGEAFGLLGPNGAGKTTTIGVITTRVRPSAGRVLVGDVDVARDPVAAKRRFAVVPQRNNLDRALTARQNLLFHGAYFGYSRAERERRAGVLLREFGLEGRGDEKTDKYSGGMAQRLMIARALMHDPELLILDEPTTGVDPQARLFVWERINQLNGQGLTILLTSHDMTEVERLCTRVAIMDHGKLLAIDTPEALKARVPGASALELSISFPEGEPDAEQKTLLEDIARALGALPGVEGIERVQAAAQPPAGPPPGMMGPWGGHAPGPPPTQNAAAGSPAIRLYSAQATALIAPSVKAVADLGADVSGMRVSKASLEDVFIHLTGRALR